MISIIVPVYNAGLYLNKCVDSILGQSYQNLQIILVDDGSSDESGMLCDAYSRSDRRVTVIHKANGGPVSARKAGVEASDGEFIGFVDADDWIERDYFEKMAEAQQKTGADIVVSNHYHEIGQDSKKVCSNITTGLYVCKQILPRLLYAGRFFEYGLQPHLVTKLFRREIVQKAQGCVNDGIVAGDYAAVFYPAVLEAGVIYVSDLCGYHYVQRLNSITKRETANEKVRCGLLLEHLERVFRSRDVWDVMEPQLAQYKKYLMLMRRMSEFDEKVLLPYGGIPKNSRVILYGAGVLGQKMHQYLSEVEGMSIILWADKNYRDYRENGMDVSRPEDIAKVWNYDYILIANTVERTADSIRQYLKELGAADEKILWLSGEFTGQIHGVGFAASEKKSGVGR